MGLGMRLPRPSYALIQTENEATQTFLEGHKYRHELAPCQQVDMPLTLTVLAPLHLEYYMDEPCLLNFMRIPRDIDKRGIAL